MTTLNARANQAWTQITGDPDEVNYAFDHQRHSFEEGWETGYKAARSEVGGSIPRERIAEVLSPWLPEGYKFEAYILADALIAAGLFAGELEGNQ